MSRVTAHCIDCGATFQRDDDQDWRVRCYRCWVQHKATDGAKTAVYTEFREHLPRLIRLCHHDRHCNTASANKATAWLLEQRHKLSIGGST